MKFSTTLSDANLRHAKFYGTLSASRKELEAVFGEPKVETEEGLITTSWIIIWEDNTASSIYDWDAEVHAQADEDEVVLWHVAGKTPSSYTYVIEQVK